MHLTEERLACIVEAVIDQSANCVCLPLVLFSTRLQRWWMISKRKRMNPAIHSVYTSVYKVYIRTSVIEIYFKTERDLGLATFLISLQLQGTS